MPSSGECGLRTARRRYEQDPGIVGQCRLEKNLTTIIDNPSGLKGAAVYKARRIDIGDHPHSGDLGPGPGNKLRLAMRYQIDPGIRHTAMGGI